MFKAGIFVFRSILMASFVLGEFGLIFRDKAPLSSKVNKHTHLILHFRTGLNVKAHVVTLNTWSGSLE